MKAILVVALGALLAACTGEEFGDLKAELKDKTKDLRGRIEPLPVVKPYEPVPYKVFDQLFKHPLTDRGLESFLKDWEKARAVLGDLTEAALARKSGR